MERAAELDGKLTGPRLDSLESCQEAVSLSWPRGSRLGYPRNLLGEIHCWDQHSATEARPESPLEPGKEAYLSSRVSRRPLLAEFNTVSAGKGKLFHYHQQRNEGGIWD